MITSVPLFSDGQERAHLEAQANVFSIVCTLDLLERAYVGDSIEAALYTEKCKSLLATLRTAQAMTSITDLPLFCSRYRLDCPAALHRIKAGVPATIEHGGLGSDAKATSSESFVALATEAYITSMDALKMNMVAVDQLFPILNDLMDRLNRVPQLGPDFVGKAKTRGWLEKLAAMRASDELTQEEARQLLYELETTYIAFQSTLR
jgi:ESCRT-I complex subunit VPS28